jgi:hypothetical protein
MSVLEKVANILGDEGDGTIASLWQILGPIFVIAAYALAPRDPLILGVGVLGLLLSSRWQLRGFSYALALLGLAAIGEHAFLTNRHLWQLGLEGSYAIAFFITSLSSQQRTSTLQSLSGQLNARDASIRNLEEEALKTHESSTSLQIALQEKIDAIQKEIEGVQSELSSLLILNEVLRKTEAVHAREKASAFDELLDTQRKMAYVQTELEESERMAARLADGNALITENRELAVQLNGARFAKEQARLISETLAREHAKESLRATESTTRLLALQSQFSALKMESDTLHAHLEQFSAERDRFHIAHQQLEEVQTERNFLKERLVHAELELSQKTPVSTEEIAHLQQKIAALIRYESLYKQLKMQFEEKGTLLHQTRAELFHTDTKLQTYMLEKEQRELQHNPVSDEMSREIAALEEECASLEHENAELQSLITLLSEMPLKTPSGEKKN